VVSDVAFCVTEVTERLVSAFARRVPGLAVETVSFANDPDACRANVRARAAHEPGHDEAFELMHVDRFFPGYVPVGDVRPVIPWRT
jgi:hypothetical protein